MTYTTTRYVPKYPVQALRGLPMQPLRGLGEITPAEQKVVEGMDRLLAVAQQQTSIVVDQAGIFVKGAAREWARNIVDQINGTRSRMLAVSKNGRLFFVDQPVVAQKLLDDCVNFLSEQVKDFAGAAQTTTAIFNIKQAAFEVGSALMKLGSAAASGLGDAALGNPVGALVIGGVVIGALYLYLNAGRIAAKAASGGVL